MNDQWWLNRYINKQAWILENLAVLNLEPHEAIILLLMESALQHQDEINLNELASKSNLSVQQVDTVISKLVIKGFLKIEVNANTVKYDLSGLYQAKPLVIEKDTTDLVSIYEREFKRPLSASEIAKLNDWIMRVDYGFLIHALREALIYRKLSFAYIDRILAQWVSDGVTLDQLNAGKRHEAQEN